MGLSNRSLYTALRPVSDTQQSRATSSIFHHQTNMASSDTDDDIIISSALLIASTLYQRRQVNVRKCKRNSLACKQTIDQSQLGNTARHVVAQLVKSWATRDVRQATLLSNKVAR